MPAEAVNRTENLDLIIVGGGPSGLACAIEAKKRNWNFTVLEKGCVVNSIYRYPVNMIFFTSAELLEIGDIPLIVSDPKPNRADGLKYYRRVVDHFDLPIRDYEEVTRLSGSEGDFTVRTVDRHKQRRTYRCAMAVIATGYYDNPNLLGIPGEDLPKVSHYYTEPHPYHRKKVAVIGGSNSAAGAALELYRSGAEVTLIHRWPEVGRSIKYWVRPDIINRIKRGEIKAFFNSRVTEVREREILLSTPEGELALENDFVLAMTGYHPATEFLSSMGIEIDPETLAPAHDAETLETNVKGIFVAGAIVAGKMTNKIFIENGRFHGERIFEMLPDSRPALADPVLD